MYEKWQFSHPNREQNWAKKNCEIDHYVGKFFGAKKSAQLVIPVRSTFQNDLHPPIGGHHPVLYFTTHVKKKYCTAMCYSLPQSFCARRLLKDTRVILNTRYELITSLVYFIRSRTACSSSDAVTTALQALCHPSEGSGEKLPQDFLHLLPNQIEKFMAKTGLQQLKGRVTQVLLFRLPPTF